MKTRNIVKKNKMQGQKKRISRNKRKYMKN